MITKIKKIHYCDYCKKHGMRGPDIKKHEEHCTLNPKRACGLCGRKYNEEETGYLTLETIIHKYKKISKIEQVVNGVDINELSDSVNNCPACILTVIRCAELQHIEFDYQKELKKWWEEKNYEEYTSQNYN